jgi:hypothetical protein
LDLALAPVSSRVKSLLKIWLETGALKVVMQTDKARRERKFIEVGQWAT